MKKNKVARKKRLGVPHQTRVSYAYASEYAKKLKRYSLVEEKFVYVYNEQRKKDEKINEEENVNVKEIENEEKINEE